MLDGRTKPYRVCWRAGKFLNGGIKPYEQQLARTLFLAMACLLCVAGYAGARERVSSGTASDGGTARLIVYRIPTMGRGRYRQVYVDDV
jgi:hypothetical protein